MRPIKTTVVASLIAWTAAGPAQAQFAVVDAANIFQTTATAATTAKQLVEMYTQVQLMRNQIQNQLQTLKSLDPTSYEQVIGLVNRSQLGYRQITAQIDNIGYTVPQIDASFDKVFPKDKAKWKNLRASDFDAYYAGWQSQITNGAQAAMRAQSIIAEVNGYNAAALEILARSKGADGEVRQLQNVTQMMGVMQTQLSGLTNSLTTVNHLTASMAASSAAEKLMTREAKNRRREGYTSPGQRVPLLLKLP